MATNEELAVRVQILENRLEYLYRQLNIAPPTEAGGSTKAIDDLLRKGDLIGAIKVYRQTTGTDLKTAKEAVEAMQRQLR